MIKLTTSGSIFYSEETSHVSPTQIAHLVREGKSLIIVDNEGYDITKEVLVEYSLGRLAQCHDPTKKELLIHVLTNIISDDMLEDIVCSGGFEDWIIRKRKMLA